MSSTFVAIAGSVAAVSLVIVVSVKLYRRCRKKRNQHEHFQFQSSSYPQTNPFPLVMSPQYPPFHLAPNPYSTLPFPGQPSSPFRATDRCMYCGVGPVKPGQNDVVFTPLESPLRARDKPHRPCDPSELTVN